MTDLARSLVTPAGSGSDADAEAVAAELGRFPTAQLEMLRDAGVGVRACRESVTDYRVDLLKETPRGWPEGVSWKDVPGCYCPDERNVVIATVDGDAGARRVPPKGVKHGAWNLVLHEAMHADDYVVDRLRCHNTAFLAARAADSGRLTTYEAQDGQAGYEETYAESAARHFGADPRFAEECPALAAFWSMAVLPLTPGPPEPERRRVARGARSIGSAVTQPDGGILLDLIAEDPSGPVGHALIVARPGTAVHAAVTRRFPARRQGGPSEILLTPFAAL